MSQIYKAKKKTCFFVLDSNSFLWVGSDESIPYHSTAIFVVGPTELAYFFFFKRGPIILQTHTDDASSEEPEARNQQLDDTSNV